MNVLTSGVPKPSLKPQSTQTIRTRPKVVNTIITVFIAHFFWTRPPYRTARAGMDISPTSVAAVICQELSPALSQLGYGFTMPPGQTGLLGPTCWLAPPRPLRIPARHMSHAWVSGVFLGCYAAGNECAGRYLEISRTIVGPGETINGKADDDRHGGMGAPGEREDPVRAAARKGRLLCPGREARGRRERPADPAP